MIDETKTRILLTGATGFVGRQVLRQLGNGFEIHCTSRRPVVAAGHWHQVDLKDPGQCTALVEAIRPQLLVHTAWNTSHGEFWEAPDNNDWFEAGRALFSTFASTGGRRIVGCGSCAEYPGASADPRQESEAILPSAPGTRYGRAKLALLHYLQELPVDQVWARIFLVYGPHEDERRLVPTIAKALADNRLARISSGQQIRDFIDVRDLGRAIAALVEAPVSGVINLGYGEPASIATVARILGDIAQKCDLIDVGALPDRPDDARTLLPDLTRQTAELGFRPAINLREGLEDALNFWSKPLQSCL